MKKLIISMLATIILSMAGTALAPNDAKAASAKAPEKPVISLMINIHTG
ncbi:hypothetical protein [Listeria booriae]|nr:hypothetical protein [Listeria booriae]MBC2389038.1 hypothetical protein [Listeria booriae]